MNYFHVMYCGEGFELKEYYFRRWDWGSLTTLLVQNFHGDGFPKVDGSICVYGGNYNSLGEFIGRRQGVGHLSAVGLMEDEDVLILMTGTIFREKKLLLTVIKSFSDVRFGDSSRVVVLGSVVCELFGAKVFGLYLRKLLATYFWAMRWGWLRELSNIVGSVPFDDCLRSFFDWGLLFVNSRSNIYNDFYDKWLGASCVNDVGEWWPGSKIPFSKAVVF